MKKKKIYTPPVSEILTVQYDHHLLYVSEISGKNNSSHGATENLEMRNIDGWEAVADDWGAAKGVGGWDDVW